MDEFLKAVENHYREEFRGLVRRDNVLYFTQAGIILFFGDRQLTLFSGCAAELWQLDREHGVLVFNIRHPLWVECDKSDIMVCTLQENVALHVLTLEAMPDKDWYDHQKLFPDQLLRLFAKWVSTYGTRLAVKRKKVAKV